MKIKDFWYAFFVVEVKLVWVCLKKNFFFTLESHCNLKVALDCFYFNETIVGRLICCFKNIIQAFNKNNLFFQAKELSLVGGKTVKDITRRIMYKLFTNDLGHQYSWDGAKGKKAFKNLTISSVIISKF